MTSKRRWGYPDRRLRCNGRPSTSDVCDSQQRGQWLACPFLDVVFPWFARSSSAPNYCILFTVDDFWHRIVTTDMAEPWQHATLDGWQWKFLMSGEDSDLLPYVFVRLMLYLWHAKHPPVTFVFKGWIRLSRSAVGVLISQPQKENWSPCISIVLPALSWLSVIVTLTSFNP